MKKIAFYNNKGGVGKTTTVLNISYALAGAKYKILVADCDKQKNAYQFFADDMQGLGEIKSTRYENIDVLCFDKITLQGRFGNSHLPPLDFINTSIGGKFYDFVIFDMPPALNEDTTSILKICDVVFVPLDLSSFSIQGVPNVTQEIAKGGVKLGGYIIEMLEPKSKRNKAQEEMLELITANLGEKLLDTKIPRNNTAEISPAFRETVFERMHWGTASQAFGALAEEILERCEK